MLTQHFNILYCLVFIDDITIIQRVNASFRNGGPFSVEQMYKSGFKIRYFEKKQVKNSKLKEKYKVKTQAFNNFIIDSSFSCK